MFALTTVIIILWIPMKRYCMSLKCGSIMTINTMIEHFPCESAFILQTFTQKISCNLYHFVILMIYITLCIAYGESRLGVVISQGHTISKLQEQMKNPNVTPCSVLTHHTTAKAERSIINL